MRAIKFEDLRAGNRLVIKAPDQMTIELRVDEVAIDARDQRPVGNVFDGLVGGRRKFGKNYLRVTVMRVSSEQTSLVIGNPGYVKFVQLEFTPTDYIRRSEALDAHDGDTRVIEGAWLQVEQGLGYLYFAVKSAARKRR
ncbi:MAG TPA: hypothetical protein VK502_02130 [Candidatus Saccharimonadales bacterium]|nr:hypothetical protein [Candidatus Saccharimonadales bacterium]